jgi:hypothetical protein
MKQSINLSHDAQDKLQACLNQTWAESDYEAAKGLLRCVRCLVDELTPDQLKRAFAVLETYSFEHPEASEKVAATLPAAPRCPLYPRTPCGFVPVGELT